MSAVRTTISAALFSLACWLCTAGLARADVIPACSSGQHFQSNPTSPGAMHHGGGQCVDDAHAASSSSCSLTPGRAGGSAAGVLVVGLAALAVRRRARR